MRKNGVKKGVIVVLGILTLFAVVIIFSILKGNKTYAANPVAEINLSEEHQEIKGFGGINIPEWVGSDMTDAQRQTAFGNGDNELGFNILRIFVNDDPNQWHKAVPTAKYAIEKGALVFASPWNPPSSMTTNSNGKRLSHDKYDAYVEHLNSFVEFMADNGVDLYAISIQNEPDYAHDWTAWSEDEILDFMKNYAGKINCRVMSPESFQYRKNIYDGILNDSEALENMDILGTHFYGTQYKDFDYPLFREKGQGKELWMTEVYYPNSDKDSNENWDQALQLSQHISNSLTDANMQAYVWWYIRRNYGPMNEDGSISKRGYVMAQFSKYARQGYIRVGATKNPTSDIYVSAYKGDGNKLAVVAINMSKNENVQSFSINENSISSVESFRTSRTENLVNTSNIEFSDKSFSSKLPAESVTTFVLTLKEGSQVSGGSSDQDSNEGSDENVNQESNQGSNESVDQDSNQDLNESTDQGSNEGTDENAGGSSDNNSAESVVANVTDINGDGVICIKDAFAIQRGIVYGFENDDIKAKADVNADGTVDESDVSAVIKYIVSTDTASDNGSSDENDTVSDTTISTLDMNEVQQKIVEKEPSDCREEQAGVKYSNYEKKTFYSDVCKREKNINVLLPANYDESKKYPVLYVLHGYWGNEDSLADAGDPGLKLRQVVGNAIAAGEAEEMIVVLPNIYASATQDSCTAMDGPNSAAYDNFINVLVKEIMPYMEENYSIKTGRNNTAITGFSMGGRESLLIGQERPDLFGYVGSICSAPGVTFDKMQNSEYPLNLLFISAGSNDEVVSTTPVGYHEDLTSKNVPHVWHYVNGGAHGSNTIRPHIYNFIRYIFK